MKKNGYLLVEIMISMLIFGLLITTIFPIVGFLLKRVHRSSQDYQAKLLMADGMEIAYAVLLSQWDAIGDNTYATFLDTSGPQSFWTLIPSANDVIEARYNRKISIATVTRDSTSGDIGPGNIDPTTKKITTQITWESGGQTKSVSADYYVFKNQ